MKTRRKPRTAAERKRLRQNPKHLKPQKHVGLEQRPKFLEATIHLKPQRRIFCQLIYYTGCRISEAHEVCPFDFQLNSARVAIECLKLRDEGIFRYVPVPSEWIQEVASTLEFENRNPYQRVWDFSKRTGARSIKKAMELAGIEGSFANSRGLRHSFCTMHTTMRTRPDLLQYWLGHKNPTTTAIYIGGPDMSLEEEQQVARMAW